MTTSVTLKATSVDQAELEKVEGLLSEMEPGSALSVLLTHVVSALGKNMDLTVLMRDQVLTPNEAADLLQMSRPHLLKLIEQGVVKEAHRVGSHRRIQMSDLLDYLHRRELARADVAVAVAQRDEVFAGLVAEGAGIPADGGDQFLL